MQRKILIFFAVLFVLLLAAVVKIASTSVQPKQQNVVKEVILPQSQD